MEMKRSKLIKTILEILLLAISFYGSYHIWWKEDIISTALDTPEGRQALAEALICF